MSGSRAGASERVGNLGRDADPTVSIRCAQHAPPILLIAVTSADRELLSLLLYPDWPLRPTLPAEGNMSGGGGTVDLESARRHLAEDGSDFGSQEVAVGLGPEEGQLRRTCPTAARSVFWHMW